MAVNEVSVMLQAEGLNVAIAVSRFNDLFTKQLLAGAVDCLKRHGASEDAVTVVWVPGADETPMAAERLAASGKFDAIIALGAVIQGSTPHANLINGQVSRSISRLALDYKMPIINGVISADNLEQAIERSGTKAGNKGWQAAQTAIEMANVYKALAQL